MTNVAKLKFANVWQTFSDFKKMSFENGAAVQKNALFRSRRELSNAYFLAKFGFDTADNEPPKV